MSMRGALSGPGVSPIARSGIRRAWSSRTSERVIPSGPSTRRVERENDSPLTRATISASST